MKRKTMNPDVPRSCLGETSHRSREVMGSDPILEPKHKIFLSHSGAQKEFVGHLCKALEDQFYNPFFDRRDESLPKGERFPELIVQAAEQCEMLIVVVSKEYFMSKWPMIELSAFVQAHKLHRESKSSSKGPKIFPLFYGLSVDALDDVSFQKEWFEKWEALAKADPKNRIIVSDWKYALDVLKSFNGLPYDNNSKDEVAYVGKIVSNVFQSIPPDIKWDDSHVQGKSSILKVIGEKIEGIGVFGKYKVKVVGLYGVGGIGKTTTCHSLCNELFNKYEGRVCHIELPTVPWSDSQEFFRKVLRDLTRRSVDAVQHLNEGQCKEKLLKYLSHERVFLAIDNFSGNDKSIELAKELLELPYHMDSLVVVTARSRSALELLRIIGDACLEMPDLGEADAMRLFLQHAIGGQEFFEVDEKRDVMTCVRRCFFSKGVGQECHYHPLALKALGLQLGSHGDHPSSWVKHLRGVKAFNSFCGENRVFAILRSGFDLLPPRDQALFMDLTLFMKFIHNDTLVSWLCSAHGLMEGEILDRLEHLKLKGLVEHVDLRCGIVTMHDLYVEFAKLEAEGHFHDPTNLKKRRWVYFDSNDLRMLKSKPKGGCWDKLIRLFIEQDYWSFDKYRGVGASGSLEGIKWDYFSNVEVLQLYSFDGIENHVRPGALNLEGLVSLRNLEIFGVRYMDGIEGLGNLESLTRFTWRIDMEDCFTVGLFFSIGIVGQLPSSLEVLEINGRVILKSDTLARCHNLVQLSLEKVEALSLDLSNCGSLESVYLFEIYKLQTLFGPGTHQPSRLHSLRLMDCVDLVDVLGIDYLVGLKTLELTGTLQLRVPNLLVLTELQVLKLKGLERSTASSKDFISRQLRELCWSLSKSSEGPNLNGCNQLEHLDLSGSNGLTCLTELGDLPALRVLDLGRCKDLLRLPDLSKSRKLEELHLGGCLALELLERDIQILTELPTLQPLRFEDWSGKGQIFRLDIRLRKVLVRQSIRVCFLGSWERWNAGEWEERDLGPPPILIRKLDPFRIEKEYQTNSDSSDSASLRLAL